MRVLLDEQLPKKLVRELVGHEVSTVQQEGWSGLQNGSLLAAASERGFEVFVTKDLSLEFQLSLTHIQLGIVVLDAPSHDIEILRPLVPSTLDAISAITPGQVVHVG